MCGMYVAHTAWGSQAATLTSGQITKVASVSGIGMVAPRRRSRGGSPAGSSCDRR